MAGDEDPQATVSSFMQAIMAERLDDARSMLHDDLVVDETRGVPYGGEYHRPQGFFELLGKINADLELAPGQPVQFLLADDTVAIRYRLRFFARSSGASEEMRVVEIFTVRDGLITELDVYYKDPTAVAALLAD
jgi:uncharacterized protein